MQFRSIFIALGSAALLTAAAIPPAAPVTAAPAFARLAGLPSAATALMEPGLLASVRRLREQRNDVAPNDARYGEQWWLQAAGAGNTGAAGFTKAWTRSTGAPVAGAAAVVAVLDSGITSHPEINPRLLPGYDFVSDTVYANDGNGRDNDPADPGDAITAAERAANPASLGGCPAAPLSSWHGTLIAGQVAAVSNNAEGVAAGNWNTRVLPVRVAGRCGAAIGDIIDGLRWAAGLAVAGVPINPHPARVIVLSYGGTDPCDANSSTPETAAAARLYLDTLAEARAAGALVVVAAGNQRREAGRPASCAGAFGVTALNREGYKATYANFGATIAIATPGGDAATGGTCDAQLADSGVVSTGNLGDVSPAAAGYAAASGTSFAAPAVASVATLMLALNPALTAAQLDSGLRASARPHVQVPLLDACAFAGNRNGRCECTSSTCGAGVLDADEALRYASAPSAYSAPVRTPVVLADARIRACAVLLGRPLPPDPPAPPSPDPDPPPAAGGSGGGMFGGGWVLMLLLAGAGLLPGPAWADPATIRKNLRARMPQLGAIDDVRRTPMAGIFEVTMGHELLYTDATGNHVLRGPLFDTRSKIDLSEARIDRLTAFKFSTLPWADAIVFRQGDGSRQLAVFVDPFCGFCKQFERELAGLKDVTIHAFVYPILGPASLARSRDIWCHKEPAKAWRDWMLNGVAPPGAAPGSECNSAALERNQALGARHNVQGTPAAVFVDGSRLPGAVRGDELERRLAAAARRRR